MLFDRPDLPGTSGGVAVPTRSSPIPGNFLTDLESDVSNLRNRIQDVYHKLQEVGFYGPPEEATKEPPSENHVRGRIGEEIRAMNRWLAAVEHQVHHLAG